MAKPILPRPSIPKGVQEDCIAALNLHRLCGGHESLLLHEGIFPRYRSIVEHARECSTLAWEVLEIVVA